MKQIDKTGPAELTDSPADNRQVAAAGSADVQI
jgi:hypothetical protein